MAALMVSTALATSTELRSTVATATGLRFRAASASVDAIQACFAIGVVLVKDRDLGQADVVELLDDERGFVVVRRADMKRIAVQRYAQAHGPGEGCHKGHFGLGGQGQCRQAGGRTDVAEQRKDVVFQQLACVLGTAVRLVTVVQLANLYAPTADAALGVELVKVKLGSRMELDTQLGRRPGEGGGLAENDFVGLRVHSWKASEACCTGSE